MSRVRLRFAFALLYFAEGAPIGFIWWTLPTLLREEGVEVEDITALTALVVLPWALKFAWAPLVDTMASERFPLRAWIVTAQFVMGAVLVPLAFIDPVASMGTLTVLLVCHAFAAATQDVAVDALCIATVEPMERGAINGWMQAGMLFGRALFGGIALMVVGSLGMASMVAAMVAVIWTTALVVLWMGPRHGAGSGASMRELLSALWEVLRSRVTWGGLLLAATAEASFKGVGAIVGPYLVDHDVSEQVIGAFFAFVSVGGMVIGALVGGRISDAVGRHRVVIAGQVMVGAAICVMALDAPAEGGAAVSTWIALGVFYLGIGLFTAAIFALFMDATDRRLGATQFSAYMGMTNLCEAWSSRLVGALTTRLGYGTAFPIAAALGLLALPLLWLVRPARPGHPAEAKTEEQPA